MGEQYQNGSLKKGINTRNWIDSAQGPCEYDIVPPGSISIELVLACLIIENILYITIQMQQVLVVSITLEKEWSLFETMCSIYLIDVVGLAFNRLLA